MFCFYSRAMQKCNKHLKMNTWPFGFVGVAEIFRGGHKHLSVRHWGPEGHHVVAPVVPDRGIFFRIHGQTCGEIFEVS